MITEVYIDLTPPKTILQKNLSSIINEAMTLVKPSRKKCCSENIQDLNKTDKVSECVSSIFEQS